MEKEYIGKYVKATKPVGFGRFEADVVNKVSLYCTLTEVDRIKFITDLIEKELDGIILNNDVITLPKPYYFNMNELKETGIVKASTDKPIYELENTYILFNVPNNLDIWSKKFKTYCSNNNKNLHDGYYRHDLELDLVFRYNSNTGDVDIAISNDRDIYFNHEQDKEKTKIDNQFIFFEDFGAVLSSSKVELYNYADYKFTVLEAEERYKEEELFFEKIRRQEENFY